MTPWQADRVQPPQAPRSKNVVPSVVRASADLCGLGILGAAMFFRVSFLFWWVSHLVILHALELRFSPEGPLFLLRMRLTLMAPCHVLLGILCVRITFLLSAASLCLCLKNTSYSHSYQRWVPKEQSKWLMHSFLLCHPSRTWQPAHKGCRTGWGLARHSRLLLIPSGDARCTVTT